MRQLADVDAAMALHPLFVVWIGCEHMFVLHRTYRYRLYPTRRQIAALERQLGAARDLYNAALEQRKAAWRQCRRSVTYSAQSAELAELRSLGLLDAGDNFWSQQEVLRRLDFAFRRFFRRLGEGQSTGYPRFKSESRFETLCFSFVGNAGGVAVTDQQRLRVQGVGHLKVKWHRPMPASASVRQVRVSKRNGRWYAAFCVQLPIPPPRPRTGEMRGLDVGIRCFASLSDGHVIPGPRSGRRAAKRIRRAQRRVTRRNQGSRRQQKAAALVARHRERVRNRRRDHAHKVAHTLIEQFDLLAVEDLRVSNMVRSARGTTANPGTNVRQKAGLNREIYDQGWAAFVRLLADKAEEAGRELVKVPARDTSRMCSACGSIDARSRGGARFRCLACGYEVHADVNAAVNILNRALDARSARTGPSGANGEVALRCLRNRLTHEAASSHTLSDSKLGTEAG